jgi:glucan phosphoethanolaminetransferase (alkaline phosphatase superfamily)
VASKKQKLALLFICLFILTIISIIFISFSGNNDDFFRKEFQLMKNCGSNTFAYDDEKNERGMILILPKKPEDKYLLCLILMLNPKTKEYNCELQVLPKNNRYPSTAYRLYTKVPMIFFESILNDKMPKGFKEALFEKADKYSLNNLEKESKCLTDIRITLLAKPTEVDNNNSPHNYYWRLPNQGQGLGTL